MIVVVPPPPAVFFEELSTFKLMTGAAAGATSITVKRTGPYQTNDVQVVDVNVDKGGILNSASTVQDFSFPFGITLSGSSIGVNRVAKLFRIVGSNWTYIQDI